MRSKMTWVPQPPQLPRSKSLCHCQPQLSALLIRTPASRRLIWCSTKICKLRTNSKLWHSHLMLTALLKSLMKTQRYWNARQGRRPLLAEIISQPWRRRPAKISTTITEYTLRWASYRLPIVAEDLKRNKDKALLISVKLAIIPTFHPNVLLLTLLLRLLHLKSVDFYHFSTHTLSLVWTS